MPPVLPDLPALLVRRVPRAPPGLLVLPDPLAQRVPPDLPALPGQPVLLDLLGLPVQLERRVPPALRAPPVPPPCRRNGRYRTCRLSSPAECTVCHQCGDSDTGFHRR